MKNLQQSIDDLKVRLKEIANVTKDLPEKEILHDNVELIYDNFNLLDRLAFEPINDDVIEYLLNDEELKPTLAEISRFRKIFNIRLELERAEKILNSNYPWEVVKTFKFYLNYVNLAKTEVKGANLQPNQNVIFLGSGPLPLSLIILCETHNLKGIGIEQEAKYVEISQRIINKLQISDKIKIIHGNHFSLPLDIKSDLIMIAAAAIPKNKIFEYLRKNIKPGTKVSYRIYEHGLRKLLDVDNRMLFSKKEDLFSFLKDYKEIKPKPPVNNTCVFGKI